MDLKTISDIFDTKLKAFHGGIALDEYEKSLYLTEAQDIYYKLLLSQFELSSDVAFKLSKVLEEKAFTLTSPFSPLSIFNGITVSFGKNIKAILRDNIYISASTAPLLDKKTLSIQEERLAEIEESLRNPFRYPSLNIALRAINTDAAGGFKKVELYLPLVSSITSFKYKTTIANMASPIILEALPDSLQIQGSSVATTVFSFADPELQEIIALAANTAINDIRQFAGRQQEMQPGE